MQPLVIEYLRTHTFRQLEEEHGVCARPSNDYSKFSLNYSQILVRNGDRLAEQCRGMVVRLEPDLTKKMLRDAELQEPAATARWRDRVIGRVEVLAWPMDRFYNHGDPAAAEVDWNDPNLRVYEKLDGTMIVLYWDPLYGRWFAATRSVPEADVPIRLGDIQLGNTTFSDLFMQALVATREDLSGQAITWNVDGFDKVVHLNKELTYVFELTSPQNRVVVRYDEPRVTLLAARHTASGREVPIESLRLQHVQRPRIWSLRSAAALKAFVDAADPASLEGAIVCDSQFRRLKIKNKAWVLSSRAKDLVTVSRRSALETALQGKLDDVIPLVEKSIAEDLLRLQSAVRQHFKRVDERFVEMRDRAAGSRKEFALLVRESGEWSPVYFNLWEGRAASALEWVSSAAAQDKLSHGSLDLILSQLQLQPPLTVQSTSSVCVGALNDGFSLQPNGRLR